MKIFTLILGCLLLIGCATALTPKGAKVRVTTNQDAVKGCELKGQVKGTSPQGGLVQNVAADNTVKEMQNQAAAMGADTVLLMTSNSSYWGSRSTGEAYDCSKKKPE